MSVPTPQMLSWPLGGIDASGRLPHARDDWSIREVMLNILLTRPGERLLRPGFGAGLLDFVHQPNNETTRRLIAGVVRKSLAQWETRVELDQVEVLPDPDDLAEVHIRIRYRARHGTRAQELSLTLSLEQ